MNKLITKIVGAALGLTMAVGVGVAVGTSRRDTVPVHAATHTVNFVAGTDTSSTTSITKTPITVSISSGTLSRTDNYRCYASNTMTISTSVGTLTSIAFTFSGSYTGGWDTSYTGLSDTSWTSASTSAQARITQIVVTYNDGGSGTTLDTPVPKYSNGSVSWSTDSNASSYDVTVDGGSVVHNAVSPYDVSGLSSPASHTVTVTAIGDGTTYLDSSAGSVTFALFSKAGTQADPYDVANARVAIDANTGVNDVYATGIVSAITTAYNSTYGNISFDMSSDGQTTSDQLRAYRATGTEAENIAVGNIVVVSGDLTKYGQTYEFAEGCTIVSRTVPTYTVSFNSNTGTGSMADVSDVSGVYTLPANGFTAPSGKTFAGWKANNVGDLLAAGASYTVTANVTFYAQWANVLTVTYHANGGTGNDIEVEVAEGNSYDVAANTFEAPAGMGFGKWNTAANGTGTEYAAGATINALNTDLDLYAQWIIPPEEKTDVITISTMEASGTSYADYTFNGPITNTPYKSNNSVNNNANIQIRSNNSNSGLVNTSSKGTIKSVKVTVASGTNSIWVYGSNTAYSSPADLFNNSKQGTRVGNFTSTTTINFTDDYAYVGIRSGSGACYISSIEITWLITPKSVDHIGASAVTNPGPFYVGTKPTLAELGVTVTAYYDAGGTDSEVVTSLASITYPSTGLTNGAANYTISYQGKTTTVSITGTVGDVYGKINSTPELINGSTIRLGTDTYVMTSTSGNSQLTGAEADPTNASDTTGATFTVGSDSEGYYFYETTENKYLALTSDNSYLSLEDDLDTDAHWTVSVAANGRALLTSASYPERFIQMNSSTHRFAAFKGGQVDIAIFMLVDNDMTEQQKTAAQVETFSNLFMHKLDVATSDESNTGNCYGTDGSDGYFAKARAALTGDWSAIQSAFSQSGDMWNRYVAWGEACGITVTYNSGIQYSARAMTPFSSFIGKESASTATIIVIVSLVSLTAIGGYFFIRKRKEQ